MAEFRHLESRKELLLEPEVCGELSPLIVRRENGSPFVLDTYGVDARGSLPGRTMIYLQPWSDMCASEFNQQRMRVMAEAAQAKLIGVDSPGIGANTSDLSSDMARRVRRGDFSEVSDLMWQAVRAHPLFDLDTTDEIVLGVNSLGASLAAEMAAHAPEGITIDRVIAYETVAFHRQYPASLMHQYIKHGTEGRRNYLDQNPEWAARPLTPGALAPFVGRQATAFIGYPAGIARRPFGEAMTEAFQRGTLTPDSLTHIVNGAESNVSSIGENNSLADGLRRNGLQVLRVVYKWQTHTLFENLPLTDGIMRDMLSHQS